MVNQSAMDVWMAWIVILWSTSEASGVDMNHDSLFDQFVCRVWSAELPLWAAILSSRYHVLVMTVERYTAIVHPLLHKVIIAIGNFLVVKPAVFVGSKYGG